MKSFYDFCKYPMRKIFLILFFIPGLAWAQWVEVSRGTHEITYFLSHKVSGDEFHHVYVPVLTNYKNTQFVESPGVAKISYLSDRALFMYDCSAKRYAIVDYTYYAEQNGKGEIVGFDSRPPDKVNWLPVNLVDYSGVLVNKVNSFCK